MVLATLLLICSIPQMDDTAKVVNNLPAVSSDSATKDSTLVAAACFRAGAESKSRPRADRTEPGGAASTTDKAGIHGAARDPAATEDLVWIGDRRKQRSGV